MMNIETVIGDVLETVAPTFPDNAPEGQSTPYIIYSKDGTEYERILNSLDSALDGITYQIDLIVDKKSQASSLGDQIETKLKSLWKTSAGGKQIQDIVIVNRLTDFQYEIEKYREIIEFKVFY